MKFFKLSSYFFLASFFQVIVVAFGIQTGFSQFAIQFTPFKVVHHFLVGQILGYMIYLLVTKILKTKTKQMAIFIAIGYSILAWGVLIVVGLHSGLIQPSWLQIGGITTTFIAFLGYGAICGLVIYGAES